MISQICVVNQGVDGCISDYIWFDFGCFKCMNYVDMGLFVVYVVVEC